LLLITVAIIGGTGAFAGEEGAGTLDLLLAQPVSRRRLVLEKSAALSLAIAIAAIASFPGYVLGCLFVDFDLSFLRIFEAVLNMLPVTLLFLAVALWGSAALPGRGAAAMILIGVVVVAYFLNAIAPPSTFSIRHASCHRSTGPTVRTFSSTVRPLARGRFARYRRRLPRPRRC